jgi:prolyl-tRNA synthetase
MDAIGASRLEMPTLLSSSLWKRSGRWEGMGGELFKLTGRGKAEYLLAPTHEEEVTKLVADEVESHRQLPVKVYQICELRWFPFLSILPE